ncbi:MAG TPA: glycosyltransferase family 39 protein [Candidatus Polarisedimenticolia bacterium]|jgi:hypothetical protein|nr:glycosyltransferase family 39 protein [Candidatus Polarisedimenticolia bacterium]
MLSLGVGTLVRVWNLHGARFVWPDEYRPLEPTLYSPFLFTAYWVPTLLFGESQEVVLFMTALLGVLSILMTFLLGQRLFDSRIGAHAAFLLSLFGLHVELSRTGFAGVLETVLILGAILAISGSLFGTGLKNSSLLLAGGFLGLLFATHAGAYACIMAFVILSALVWKQQGRSFKKTMGGLVALGSGFLSVPVVVEIVSRVRVLVTSRGLSYSRYLWASGEASRSMLPVFDAGNFSSFVIFLKGLLVAGGTFQGVLVLAATIFCGALVLLERKRELTFVVGMVCLTYVIFCTLGYLCIHPNYPRYLVYLTPLLCLCMAYTLARAERRFGGGLVVVVLVVYAALSLPKVWETISHTFKIEPITQWLDRRKIPKERIATMLDLRENGVTGESTEVPGEKVDPPWGYYRIDWERMKTLYEQGRIRFLMTSGLGTKSTVGYRDGILASIKPLKTWAHPLRFRNPENMVDSNRLPDEKVQDFSLYDLGDIFVEGADRARDSGSTPRPPGDLPRE